MCEVVAKAPLAIGPHEVPCHPHFGQRSWSGQVVQGSEFCHRGALIWSSFLIPWLACSDRVVPYMSGVKGLVRKCGVWGCCGLESPTQKHRLS